MIIRILFVVLLFVLPNTVVVRGQPSEPIVIKDVKYCDLMKSPNSFLGIKIRVLATYVSSLESAWLTCPDRICPETSILSNLLFDPNWRDKSDSTVVKQFEDRLEVKDKQLRKPRKSRIRFVGQVESDTKFSDAEQKHFVIRVLWLEAP